MSGAPLLDLETCRRIAADAARPGWRGRIDVVSGVLVEAAGVPAGVGELCRIDRGPRGPVDAEVVGFRGARTLLMPHGDLDGIAPHQLVTAGGRPFEIAVGGELLGRTVDGFGAPCDAGGRLPATLERRRVRGPSPDPLSRRPVTEPLATGVRAIDGLCTLGRGQRLGIFSGSGVGKSTLLGQVARGTEADVIVVALVGERGREVRAFVDDVLGDEGRRRSVVVVATSDRPPIERFTAPFTAATVAEWFRDRGLDVLLVMDSVTRFAMASREIGLAAGEPPTVRGFPPSFFATVPKLVERMGAAECGSVTALLTVLLEGDDADDPVGDTLRGLLDGHVYLSRDLANHGHFPAVDVLASLSRLMEKVAGPDHRRLAAAARETLARWRDGRDLVEVGAYRKGSDPALDRAIERLPYLDAFLRQEAGERSPLEESVALLGAIFAESPA